MAATIPLTPLRPWQPRLGAHRLIALFELRRRLVERDRVVADRDARDLGDVAILVQSRSMICQARCVDSGMPIRIAILWVCNAFRERQKPAPHSCQPPYKHAYPAVRLKQLTA